MSLTSEGTEYRFSKPRRALSTFLFQPRKESVLQPGAGTPPAQLLQDCLANPVHQGAIFAGIPILEASHSCVTTVTEQLCPHKRHSNCQHGLERT